MSRIKIAYIAAGAGGMYCGNCLHDNTLASSLMAAGHEVLLIPTYTPLRTDEEDVSQKRVFFGGINVYLQQKSSFFRHTPWFLDRLLDSPALIEYFARRALSVDAKDLGAMTVSMLQGEKGLQRKELDKLVQWLREDVRPNVVHLSNVLLAGMAGEIRRQLNVPVFCTLSGEDLFLDELQEPYTSEAHELLKARAKDVDALISLNRYYAQRMSKYLSTADTQMHVIPHGLHLEGHGTKDWDRPADAFVIGYLARIAPEKGLHLLVDAFQILAAEEGLPPLRLRVAGYLGKRDQPYLDEVLEHVADAGLDSQFEYLGEVDRQQKIEFLQSLDCASMPTTYPESKGLPVIEALANAVPVVVPRHGTFPETIEETQGGLLFEPNDPQDLAAVIRRLIADHSLARQLGEQGQRAVREKFTAELMAERTLALYQQFLPAAQTSSAPEPCGASKDQAD